MNDTDPNDSAMDTTIADLKEFMGGSAAVMDFIRNGKEGTFENPYLSKRREQSLSRIHEVMRGFMLEKLSGQPATIRDRLSVWAEDARAESLTEYLVGLFPKLSDADHRKLEDKVVAAYKAIGGPEYPSFASWTVLASEPGERDTCVTAWMEARRCDALPPIPEGEIIRGGPPAWETLPGYSNRHLCAVDGLLELFQCLRWETLACSLENPEWLHLLANWWLVEKVEEEEKRLEKEKAALALDGRHRIILNGNEYGHSPKEISGMAWATGQGIKTELDCGGKTGIFFMPPGARLMKNAHKGKPHQDSLPMTVPGPFDDASLPLIMAHGDREMMPAVSAKLLLLATNVLMPQGSKHILKATLKQLATELNPGARLMPTHYESVMKGIRALSGLSVVLSYTDWQAYQIILSEIPIRELRPEEYDEEISLMINPLLMDAMTKRNKGTSYAGHFLYNLTGVMKLDVRRPALIRHYLRAAAAWNAARNRKGPILVDEKTETWALITNTMTASAVEGKRHQSKSESIKRTISDVEELANKYKLVIPRKVDKERIVLEIPEDLEDAYQSIRNKNPRS
jgi:hypothetical protein